MSAWNEWQTVGLKLFVDAGSSWIKGTARSEYRGLWFEATCGTESPNLETYDPFCYMTCIILYTAAFFDNIARVLELLDVTL
jgi:hypothetical protein